MRVTFFSLLLRTLLSFLPTETAGKRGTKQNIIYEDKAPLRFGPSVIDENALSVSRESCRGSDQAKVSQAVAVAVSEELPVTPADLLNR